MALFTSSPAFLGLDLSTSTIKIVELIDRKKRIELTTYAQANVSNLLLKSGSEEEDSLNQVATIIARMVEKSHAMAEFVVCALPSSIVFSTVLMLPNVNEVEMERAVHVAARDVVPLDIDQMVLGWSRLGHQPHMDVEPNQAPLQPAGSTPPAPATTPTATTAAGSATTAPVFLTAAPKEVVRRYLRLIEILGLQLYALEVETFPLARSLLNRLTDSAMIIDIGTQVTSFHIIDRGTPRLSHALEYGGKNITQTLADALKISQEEADILKTQHGLGPTLPPNATPILQAAVLRIAEQAKKVMATYQGNGDGHFDKTILIGGGALMPGLAEIFAHFLGQNVNVGNPWRGLSYPDKLEYRLHGLGPQYAVAVGLALRGFEEKK